MLHIHLFGQMRVTLAGQPVRLPALARGPSLWAYLLLNRSQPLERARLAYTFWGDVSEEEALANLRRHLYELRRALPPPIEGCPWLLAAGTTLQWNPEAPCWLDVAEFERLAALPDAAAAVDLYTADLLLDRYDDWIIPERERLRSSYLDLLRRLVDQAINPQPDYPRAIHYAGRLLAAEPLNEEHARRLIELRFQSGDRGGAIQEYQRLKERLMTSLGVAPLPQTRRLIESILAPQPLSTVPPAAAPVEPPQTPPAACRPRHNLPAQVTSFVGRENELSLLLERLSASSPPMRLLTLTGPGGVGKTRLALELAARLVDLSAAPENCFADGVFFISLADLRHPVEVLPAIAAVLGVQETAHTSLQDALLDYLRHKRLLLVLDNFEQVIAAAPLPARLLREAPQLTLLVTSRTRLNLYGEHEYPLPLLPLPDLAALPPPEKQLDYAAVALFVDRARQVSFDFKLAPHNASAVAELCTRLDGLPLAIELAAIQLRNFTPSEITLRLSAPADLAHHIDIPDRHRALNLTMDWSYSLLGEEQQRFFRRLGLLAGNFDLSAAAEVASTNSENLTVSFARLLAGSLVAHSLLRPALTASPGADEPRYRMLATIREYALEQLERSGERTAGLDRLCQYYSRLATQAASELCGPQQIEWLPRLEAELDCIRGALDGAVSSGWAEPALQISAGLLRLWEITGRFDEGRRWLTLALDLAAGHAQTQLAHLRLSARLGLAALARMQGDLDLALQCYQAGQALAESLGEGQTANRVQTEIRHLYGEPPEQIRSLQDLEGLLEGYRQSGETFEMAEIYLKLGNTALYREDYLAAQRYYTAGLELRRSLGDSFGASKTINNLGVVAAYLGDYASARDLHRESLNLRRQFRARPGIAQSLHNLSLVLAQLDQVDEALHLQRESLELRWEMGSRIGVTENLETLGQLAVAAGQMERSARLLGAAEELRRQTGGSLDAVQRRQLEQARDALSRALSPSRLEAAWSEGQRLRIADAVALALD